MNTWSQSQAPSYPVQSQGNPEGFSEASVCPSASPLTVAPLAGLSCWEGRTLPSVSLTAPRPGCLWSGQKRKLGLMFTFTHMPREPLLPPWY